MQKRAKVERKKVNVVATALPRYLKWSEQSVTWSREDHPEGIEHPGLLALVVAPQVDGFCLNKVLMDGGSSINILYLDTFQRMGLSESRLTSTSTIFHRIVPGKSAHPIGKIILEVAFGVSKAQYRSEYLTFEVVDLKNPYNPLFGRPAYANFMARPCYVYHKLKIPGPQGIITIEGSKDMEIECDRGDAIMADQACSEKELKYYKSQVNPADKRVLDKPTHEEEKKKFKSAQDTKMVDFVEGDSSKQFSIGSHMDPK